MCVCLSVCLYICITSINANCKLCYRNVYNYVDYWHLFDVNLTEIGENIISAFTFYALPECLMNTTIPPYHIM